MSRGPSMIDLPHSSAAERNAGPILDVLRGVLPRSGTVLEIASGTGQHVVRFAEARPDLAFRPTDLDPANLPVIAERVRRAGLANVRGPVALDVTERPWPVGRADAVLCINMVHISPWPATLALLDGAAAVLPAGAPLFLYGPYLREGVATAPGNVAFDADLRRRDGAWGLRDLGAVAGEAVARGFGPPELRELPADNLAVTFRRSP